MIGVEAPPEEAPPRAEVRDYTELWDRFHRTPVVPVPTETSPTPQHVQPGSPIQLELFGVTSPTPTPPHPRLKVGKLRTLDDALRMNEAVAKAFAAWEIEPEDVAAFTRIVGNVVAIVKARAVAGEGRRQEVPDFSAIGTNADIEAARPAIVVAKSFGEMTEQERRGFFEKVRPGSGARATGSNGTGAA